MALRCLLFSSDEPTSAVIRQVLAGLGVEGESCADGPTAVEKVIQQSFQIVIIDWDMQPEAGLLLTTARERKTPDRPLTLAIVSDDAIVPKALQAGANSILRKPVLVNQAQDTLGTGCDLLRARESAAQAATAAGARPASLEQGSERHLRAGEFLQSSEPRPGGQFVVDSETQRAFQPSLSEVTSPLKELEPMAAAVERVPSQPEPISPTPIPPLPPEPDGPRGLEWYLNRAGVSRSSPREPIAAAPAPVPAKPELIGYEQTAAETQTAEAAPVAAPAQEAPAPESPAGPSEQQAEAQLFAYITEGYKESGEQRARFLPGKKTLGVALALAACGILAAPQAPWHRGLLSVWAHGHRAVHGWLNPQTVTAPQAPASHEDFARPGDEYKLPVAENIPDATTDPSQIRVIPVVDPTAKKPNTAAADAGPTAEQTEGTGTTPVDQSQAPAAQVQENAQAGTGATAAAPAVSAPTVTVPAAGGSATPGTAAGAAAAAEQLRSDAQAAASSPPLTAPGLAPPQPPIGQLPHSVSTPPATNSAIPQSLKSDIASMTPEASGTKSPEAALPSIEPVAIPEATARELLTDQPAPAYPASAKGQQGTVVLQVQIGRDGTVQNAKFLQGSLAFARAAIDAAKQWKFKPYLMNGRPVSVETQLTISFKPGA